LCFLRCPHHVHSHFRSASTPPRARSLAFLFPLGQAVVRPLLLLTPRDLGFWKKQCMKLQAL
jgi:hypothetical protein